MTALKYGFAVAATDTGHDANAEPLATFATNRQKLVDYAFRAVHTRPKPPRNWCALIMESHNHAPISTVVPRGVAKA